MESGPAVPAHPRDVTEVIQVTDTVESLLGARDVVVAEGADALSYLQSQLTQDIAQLAVGERRWTLVLSPNGRIEGFAHTTRTAENRFELSTDAGYGTSLRERLQRFRIRVDVDLEVASEGDPTPAAAAEAARIELGWPRLGAELIPGETLVGGTGLADIAVSFTKGCYPGQELVERMDSRAAEAPRTLRRFTVADGTQPGDPIEIDGVEVGSVTSVAAGLALGWVKRGTEYGEPVRFAS